MTARQDQTEGKNVKENKRRAESGDTELVKPNKHFYVPLVGHGRHKRPEGRQR